jgi:hypothetical protein
MIVLLESARILGLGVGLFTIVVVILVGLVASMLAWTFNKGLPVLLAFMGITLVLVLVFVLSPKSSDTTEEVHIEYDHSIIVRGSVGAVLGFGVLVGLLGAMVSHVLVPVYAMRPNTD